MYKTSIEHIMAELERVDLLIRAKLSIMGQGDFFMEPTRGLVISPEEIDALLKQPLGMPIWAIEADEPKIKDAVSALSSKIEGNKKKSLENKIVLRLDMLCASFGLTRRDVDILLLALSTEIDLRYERFFAFLQDDVTQKNPCVDLILNLLAYSYEEKILLRKHFSLDAPLIKNRLINLISDSQRPDSTPILKQAVKTDERIVSFLLETDDIDGRILPYSKIFLPSCQLEDMVLGSEFKKTLETVFNNGKKPAIFYFQGDYGAGRKTAANCFCKKYGKKLFVLETKLLLKTEPKEFKAILNLIIREAILCDAAFYIEGFDLFIEKDKELFLYAFVSLIEGFRQPVFLAGKEVWEPKGFFYDVCFFRVEFPKPSFGERLEIWDRHIRELPRFTEIYWDLDTQATDAGKSTLDVPGLRDVALMFAFTGGQIKDAAATAFNLARQKADGKLEAKELFEACRLQSNRKLKSLAQQIEPHYRWEDIVLPQDKIDLLKDICSYVKYRSLVYDDWGFKDKLALGRGLNVIFSGPSGTGKTMSADIIANELGLDLYKIDLSRVVSKYIGETEKNLSKIFYEAESSNAILFFDEADAIFGKRSEVKDAHDRYANIETGYLLQKMEEHTGIAILATNFKQNIDSAFLRRMHFVIDFPNPKTEDRQKIWEKIWPKGFKVNGELKFDFMAKKFELPGGNIRNIAIASAFAAASRGDELKMEHLIRSTKREYQKIGKIVIEDDFDF